MQCSSIKRLFEDDSHDWKVIPLFLIDKHLAKFYKFSSFIIKTSDKNLNFIGQLFNDNGSINPWKDLKL